MIVECAEMSFASPEYRFLNEICVSFINLGFFRQWRVEGKGLRRGDRLSDPASNQVQVPLIFRFLEFNPKSEKLNPV